MRRIRQSLARAPLVGRSPSAASHQSMGSFAEGSEDDSGSDAGAPAADSAAGPPTSAAAAPDDASDAGSEASETLEEMFDNLVNTVCFWDNTPDIDKLAASNIEWVDDETVTACFGCEQPFEDEWHSFVTGSGKHHCRGCGRVFCDDCTATRIPMPDKGLEDAVRACEPCAELQTATNEFLVLKPMLTAGQRFLKHHQAQIHRGNEFRFVYLSPDGENVCWSKTAEAAAGAEAAPDAADVKVIQLPVGDVLNVLPGQQTNVFQRSGDPAHEHLCFSIVAASRTLDLECDTQEIRDLWVRGLQAAVAHTQAHLRKKSARHEAQQRASLMERRQQELESHRQSRERTRQQLSELRQAHTEG